MYIFQYLWKKSSLQFVVLFRKENVTTWKGNAPHLSKSCPPVGHLLSWWYHLHQGDHWPILCGLNKGSILWKLSSWPNLCLRVAFFGLIRAFPGLGSRALILLLLLLAASFLLLELTNQKTNMPTAVMTLEQVMEKRRDRMQNYCNTSG